jgi:hypothetical protein
MVARPYARVAGGPGLPDRVVQRLLCNGRIRTVIGDGAGTVLDVGRSDRLVADRQYRALLLLCERHHVAHHAGEFEILTLGAGRFRFISSNGRDLSSPLRSPASTDTGPLEEDEQIAVSADAATPQWDGQRLDRGYAISVLAQRREVAS